jgi:C4-dicarboxylate-specific signal transduction histidine kinase
VVILSLISNKSFINRHFSPCTGYEMKERDIQHIKFSEEYERIALSYLRNPQEEGLYQASLLSRDLIKAGFGPNEALQLHSDVTDRILKFFNGAEQRENATKILHPLQSELMAVYSEYHQSLQDVLKQLQANYDELDASRDELREKTSQLIQTEKMTALGELSASLAHEINQPLNAMNIICQDILRDIRKNRHDPEYLEVSLQDITNEIMSLAEIVDHMGIYTRRTEGTIQDVVDINEPVEGVFKLMNQQLRARNIEVVKDMCTDLYVMGDPIRLGQVFMNLITNARDAVEQNKSNNGKKVLIRTYSVQDTGQVAFEISDNGSGIPEHLRAKIFESFFTSKAPGQGTGLGLSVTKEIVEEHDGVIDVQSTEGNGTTFKVVLPAYSGAADNRATQ